MTILGIVNRSLFPRVSVDDSHSVPSFAPANCERASRTLVSNRLSSCSVGVSRGLVLSASDDKSNDWQVITMAIHRGMSTMWLPRAPISVNRLCGLQPSAASGICSSTCRVEPVSRSYSGRRTSMNATRTPRRIGQATLYNAWSAT